MTAGRSCGRRTLTRSVCSRREMRPSPSSTASTASRCRVIPKRLQNWHHPGDTLLSLLKETSANGEQYTAGFWDVEQKLKDAESVAGKQLSEAQKSYNTLESQLKAQQSMLDALGYNNNSLDAINAQIVTVGNQLAKALGNLNAAQSNPNYGGTTSGGGYVSWEDKLLQKKADALNEGRRRARANGWRLGRRKRCLTRSRKTDGQSRTGTTTTARPKASRLAA